MGLINSKETTLLDSQKFKPEKYLGELKDNMRQGKGTYIYKEGHRYEGDWNHDKRHGKGTYYLKTGELYIGEWIDDMKNGLGKYFYQNGERYIGEWKHDLKEGKGQYHYTDGSYFEGTFINDRKHGTGQLFLPDGTHIEETYKENSLHSKNNEENAIDIKKREESGTKAKAEFKEITSFEIDNKNNMASEAENDKKGIESIDEKVQFSEFKSDIKTLDIGLETLSLIDQIEMMNSLNSSLLNKNLQDWTYDDVSEWLSNTGLADYMDSFKSNHISGKNLLDLTDKELKDELGMFSIGHRKNFGKSQEHLRKIYSKNKIFNQAIRMKLRNFYQKHKSHLKSSLYSQISPTAQKMTSLNVNSEIIEEDQSDSMRDSLQGRKENPPHISKKMVSYENYADDEEEYRPIEKEKEVGSALKKTKSKKISEAPSFDNKLSKEMSKSSNNNNIDINNKNNTNDNNNNEGNNDKVKELNIENNDNNDNNAANINNNKVSESSSTSSSSSSSEDETKKKKEKALDNSRSPIPLKIHRKQPGKAQKGQQYSSSLDKNFVLKTLKDVGIGINFLLDPQELEIMQKIGEGGYGDVYYGKWLGQDVAIKHFGKNYSKFHKKKLADFIKEVEVISNLRHPNILLYMGVCINCPRFDCPNYLMLTEYLEGGSLFDLLHKKRVKLNEDRLILIAEDIALGMNYLHSRKVFHRDLKSSNILVDSNWNIKICDFGLSTVKSQLTRKKHRKEGRIGTPHWMAPEIMRSEEYEEFSDTYSYGMILWEMVVGEIPYNGLSVTQIIGSVGYDNLQVPIPKEGNTMILDLMRRCLDREKVKRPFFSQIVENLQNKNRGKENRKFVIKELKKFFNEY